MRSVRFRARARQDLIDVHRYISLDNPSAADRVIEKIEVAIRSLAEMPGKGHRRVDVRNPAYRFWSVYSYVIAYRFDDEHLDVVRVVHGRRNIRRLFTRRS